MKKTHIIAELAWGHDGSVDQAIKIMKMAKTAGANSFSFHITDMPSYMVPYYGSGEGKVSAGRENLEVYKYLENINLSKSDWKKVSKTAMEINIDLCVMPNDFTSLEYAEDEIKPEYYVISAACFVEEEFLREIARKQRKTFFRIGGAYLGEIEKAISIFRQEGNNQIVLLHGFQNYPTKLEETDLALLSTLKKLFGVEVGLADHIDGGSDLAMVIPIIALSFGATYIEKHITLDRAKKSEDFESSLDPENFSKMVKYIRGAEIAIGSPSLKELSEATLRYRNISRKRIVASKPINKEEKITLKNTTFKRSDIGLTPDKNNSIVGRKAIVALQKDDAITFDKIS